MKRNRVLGAESYNDTGDVGISAEVAGVLPVTFERWLECGLMEEWERWVEKEGKRERIRKGLLRADDLSPDDVVGLIQEAVDMAREDRNAKDILRAAEMLAKCMGLYHDTIRHDHNVVMMPEIKLGGGEVLRLGFGKEVIDQ